MNFISLTAEEAAQVAGPTSNGAALYPVPHGQGFILGLGVLDDPNHAMHHAFLSSLPTIEVEVDGQE